ncbi:MAG: cytidylate kinase [Desulforhopalus sp.]|jgi:cytidylate kinase
MPIISISRGSYSRGKEVAERLAERLGYECVSRDILLETCEEFSIPETRLIKALHDAPSILDRFTHGRERYISYFRAAFFKHMVKNNIVYHGLFGHFFLNEIRHTIKVLIIANMDHRIADEMQREKCSAEEARYQLKKDDDERRKWGLSLHGKDTMDCNLYDLVLNVDIIEVEKVVDILQGIIEDGRFDETPESIALLKQQAMIACIHAIIVNDSPRATVEINNGVATLGNIEGRLQNDTDHREKTAKRLIRDYNLQDVVYSKAATSKKDHINPFYNLDVK